MYLDSPPTEVFNSANHIPKKNIRKHISNKFIILLYFSLLFILITFLLVYHQWESVSQFSYDQLFSNSLLHNIQSNVKVVIIIPCLLEDIDLRHRVRSTHGLCSLYNNTFPAVTRFFVANNASPVSVENWQLFHMEMNKFKDIVWDKGFVDTPKNVSIKIIRALRWTEIHYPNIWFVVKVEINAFFSLSNLLDYLSKVLHIKFDMKTYYLNPPPLLIGNIFNDKVPIRSVKSEGFVSNKEYPFQKYPSHTEGLFYILNHLVISIIMKNYSTNYESKQCQTSDLMEIDTTFCAFKKPFLSLEDVFITGLLVKNTTRLHYYDINKRTNYENEGEVDEQKVFYRHSWDLEHHKITDCSKQSEKFVSNDSPKMNL